MIWRVKGYWHAIVAMMLPSALANKISKLSQSKSFSPSPVSASQKQATVKVLIVGQTPPPYHGQAIMIERLLSGKYAQMQLYHVRMAFSDSIDSVGRFQLGKIFHLFGVIVQIFYYRIFHSAKVLYYPPAGPNRVPLYRDLIILNLTRWMFHRTILHFHAGGVSELYPKLNRVMQLLFRRALFYADASIRISYGSPEDGRSLEARHEFVVPYGIEDEYARYSGLKTTSAGNRVAMKAAARGDRISSNSESSSTVCELEPLRLLFVGILRESKGLLVLLEACGMLAARKIPFELTVVGQFQSQEFEQRVRQQLSELSIASQVRFLGALQGTDKWQAYAEASVFCFPTFYEAETFGVVLIEAMSFELPVVATRWRGIPDIVDDCETGFLVEPHDVMAVADRLAQLHFDPPLREQFGKAGRQKFLQEFTTEQYLGRMEDVIVATATG